MPFESDNESTDSALHDIPAEIQSENFYFGKNNAQIQKFREICCEVNKEVVPIHVTNR